MKDGAPYVKYMPYHSISNASRNKRELAVAAEAGFLPVVFSHDKQAVMDEAIPHCQYIWDGSTPLNPSIPKIKRILMVIYYRVVVIRRTLQLPVGVWSCHDLKSLKIAYMASRFKSKKPVLIYDSHEFEMGRNAKRNKLQMWGIKHEERFLMKRCAFSIVVNDSIADELQRIHRLKDRPIVVRSTPDYWEIDEEVCKKQRQEFMEEFAKPGGGYPPHHVPWSSNT